MQLVESRSEIAWRDSLFALASSLGFDTVVFAIVASKQSPIESAFIHSNYPQSWREYYCMNRKYNIDPTVQHCMRSSVPVIWTPQIYATPAQRELYEKACSYGLATGISFPIHSPAGEVGLISFSTRDLQICEFGRQVRSRMAELSLVRDYAFQSSLSHFQGESRPNRHLN
jgi:LuxR family quorum-sensing transcriptional regulator LasR